MRGHDVDRAAFAVFGVGHLHENLPAEGPQPANGLGYQGGVVLVEETVDFASPPAHVGFPSRVNRSKQAPHGIAC